MKSTFDKYAEKYDEWYQKNQNFFFSQLNLLALTLQGAGNDILSVGCGSGLFEEQLKDNHDIEVKYAVEPSEAMAKIAEARGLSVEIGKVEDIKLASNRYDAIFFNGSSTYIADLKSAYKNAFDAVKEQGRVVILDVPKGSALGLVYKLASTFGTWNHEFLNDIEPEYPLPIELMHGAVWHSTEEKVDILKQVGFKGFSFAQTLTNHPKYINEQQEDPVEGFSTGNFVAIIAEK